MPKGWTSLLRALLSILAVTSALSMGVFAEPAVPEHVRIGYDGEGTIDASPSSCETFVREMVVWDEAEIQRAIKEVCDARRRHIEAYEALQENYRALAAMIAEDKRLDVVAAAQHLETMMKACINHKLNLTTGGHNIRIDIIPNDIATKCLNLGAKLLQDEADALAIP